MKELFEQVIALKNYDLKALLANIDQYHIEGSPTGTAPSSINALKICAPARRSSIRRTMVPAVPPGTVMTLRKRKSVPTAWD